MDRLNVASGSLAGVAVHVFSVHGTEAVNELYSFSIRAGLEHHELAARLGSSLGELPEALLGQRVQLQLGTDGPARHGMVSEALYDGTIQHGGLEMRAVSLTVVPRAWLMSRRRNSRIFQARYPHEIVSTVLAESGVRHRWALRQSYPRRIYCTQYQETDLDLVMRLFAEEGIFFFFEHAGEFRGGRPLAFPHHRGSDFDEAYDDVTSVLGAAAGLVSGTRPDDADPLAEPAEAAAGNHRGEVGDPGTGEVLVFTDCDKEYVRARSGPGLLLHLSDADGMNEHAVKRFGRTRRVESGRLELRDYDFRRPLFDLVARHGDEGPAAEVLEVYEHHGEHDRPDVNDEQAATQLEQIRAREHTYAGSSTSPFLIPGHVFELDAGSEGDLGGAHAVTRVVHRSVVGEAGGVSDAVALTLAEALAAPHRPTVLDLKHMLADIATGDREYSNRFECVRAERSFRPPRPPRVLRNVTETATVVGPAGSEIYTDGFGRIKVQFHWDREGTFNEHSSCWIRVIQPLAGAGFGFQFIPRVGMEVLVTFIGGDPDRPVVVGSVYNQAHVTPHKLPLDKAKSGIRTQSTPGGKAFNEIAFDDSDEAELLELSAARDLRQAVAQDIQLEVGRHEQHVIGLDRDLMVGGTELHTVTGVQRLDVGAERVAFVGGDRTERLRANRLDVVEGSALETVRGLAVTTIAGAELRRVEGSQSVSVHGDATLQVGPHGGEKSQHVVFVDGKAFHTATEHMLLRVTTGDENSLRLECGDSSISIHSDHIRIRSAQVIVEGSDELVLRGGSANATFDGGVALVGKPIELSAEATIVSLDGSTTEIKGSTIQMKTGSTDPPPEETTPTETVEDNLHIAFHHQFPSTETGSAIADTPFRLVTGNIVKEASTDADGVVAAHVAEGTTSAEITLYADRTYPALYSSPLVYQVKLGDILPASDLEGARHRLRSLGYRPGSGEVEGEGIDSVTRAAIIAFQLDRELKTTGELDDDTLNALNEGFGC